MCDFVQRCVNASGLPERNNNSTLRGFKVKHVDNLAWIVVHFQCLFFLIYVKVDLSPALMARIILDRFLQDLEGETREYHFSISHSVLSVIPSIILNCNTLSFKTLSV